MFIQLEGRGAEARVGRRSTLGLHGIKLTKTFFFYSRGLFSVQALSDSDTAG